MGFGVGGLASLTPPPRLNPQELDSLRHQVDQLAEENVELEMELQRSLELPPNSPGEGEQGAGEGLAGMGG